MLDNLYGGRYDLAWEDLHPAHQQIAPRSLFVRCSAQVATTGDLESIEVLDVFDDNATIPGIQDGEVEAVRVRVNSLEGDSDTFVNHQVKVGEKWHWVLNADAFQAYQEKRCPADSLALVGEGSQIETFEVTCPHCKKPSKRS